MRYKVEFENNIPVHATKAQPGSRVDNLTDFGEVEGKSSVKFLYVEAENEHDALEQAQRIVRTIFKF
jgi:hypothetical protein